MAFVGRVSDSVTRQNDLRKPRWTGFATPLLTFKASKII